MGGQASVYVRNGIAYKIYTDPKDAIPEDKFKALSAITDPCVIRPSQLLLDEKKKHPVGYTMDAVADNFSLCQLFTKAFRDRNHVTNDQIVNVTAKLRSHVSNVHAAGIVIVDLNELNVLVSKAFDETYMIDVDSYQTPGYPATFIMPSVRDWSAKKFTELSDWFSYAVIAFQLFVGNHPYQGTHQPSANVDKDKRLEHRMRNNLSAFRSDVSLPKCCYPFDVIPQTFRDWLKAVLDDGKRVAPPDPKGGPVAVLVTAVRVLVSTGKLSISEVLSYDGWELTGWIEGGAQNLAFIQREGEIRILLNGATVQALRGKTTVHELLRRGQTLLGFTPKYERPVALNLHEGQLTFVDLEEGVAEPLGMRADELTRAGERFYIRNGTRVLEVEFYEVVRSKVTVLASHSVADVLEMASRLYEGCAVQNMLGSVFVSLFPRHRAGYQVRMAELDSYKIVDAKFDGGVLMVIGAKGGRYDRLVFRFDPEFATYDLRTIADISPTGLNFITLSTGICVALTEEETLEAFSARQGVAGVRVVEDTALGNDLRLTKVGGKAGFTRGDKVYQVSLK
jgi:hypothetical protein